ncbi:hypothetical protein ADEAN_000968700 [Angomonas deanei]|uniref:Uncharacterized protein n=1 Tax=Angomonas deanei TaxID=59799 RepID=A0A7G2CQQ3_9TRYP|nr:hypothetical protein ADEAN_000968700 [Angomonas deanei]
MLRFSRVCREHYETAMLGANEIYYTPSKKKKKSLFRRGVRKFKRASPLRRLVYVAGGLGALLTGYTALCAVLFLSQYRMLQRLVTPPAPSSPTREPTVDPRSISANMGGVVHHNLEVSWGPVGRSLQVGDVVLLAGSDRDSVVKRFCQLWLNLLYPATMRYSHVAVVVEPAEFVEPEVKSRPKSWFRRSSVHEQLLQEEKDAALREKKLLKKGVTLLMTPINGGKVEKLTDQQLFSKRRNDKDGESGDPLFEFCGVRRVIQEEKIVPLSYDKESVAVFCDYYVGKEAPPFRPTSLLASSLLPSSLWNAVVGNHQPVGSDASVVVSFFQHLGLIEKHWVWVPLQGKEEVPPPLYQAYSRWLGSQSHATLPPSTAAPTPADREIELGGKEETHLFDSILPHYTPQRPLVQLPEDTAIENADLLFERSALLRYGQDVDHSTNQRISLRAGHLARGKGQPGTLYQLRYYYQYNPRQYTTADVAVNPSRIDFASSIDLGRETLIPIANRKISGPVSGQPSTSPQS